MCARRVTVRHVTPCRCFACRSERIERAVKMRTDGASLTMIAETLNIGIATAYRLSRRVPTPDQTIGQDGKTYRRRGSMGGTKGRRAASS